MPFHLKNLLGLWRALSHRIINLIQPTFTIFNYFVHLFFGDEAAVVSESVVGEVFAAVIPDMLPLILSL